jgi:hypothetical protein
LKGRALKGTTLKGKGAEGERDGDSEDLVLQSPPDNKPAWINRFSGTLMIVNDAYNADNGLLSHAQQSPNDEDWTDDDSKDDEEEEEGIDSKMRGDI